jgi:hypothetical protein
MAVSGLGSRFLPPLKFNRQPVVLVPVSEILPRDQIVAQ